MKGLELATRYSDAELLSLQAFIDGDPRSRNPEHAKGRSIYIYTAKVRKLHSDIGWAIAYHRGFDKGERVERVQGGFGCVEANPNPDFKAVRDFFEKAVFGPSRAALAATVE